MGALEGRTAVITGGASGIGQAIAELFATEGARVGVIDRQPCTAFASVCADVTDPSALGAALAELEQSNGAALILVNAAGIDEIAPIEEVSLDQWNRMLAVHMTGTFLATQICLPAMKTAGWGRVINLASQLGHKGAPGMVPYCAAKSGIIGFSKALAHEAAPFGITVNCLAPGPIDTPLVASLPQEVVSAIVAELPLRRLGRVEEVAHTALMLAREEGGFYTGTTLNMNGGHYML